MRDIKTHRCEKNSTPSTPPPPHPHPPRDRCLSPLWTPVDRKFHLTFRAPRRGVLVVQFVASCRIASKAPSAAVYSIDCSATPSPTFHAVYIYRRSDMCVRVCACVYERGYTERFVKEGTNKVIEKNCPNTKQTQRKRLACSARPDTRDSWKRETAKKRPKIERITANNRKN